MRSRYSISPSCRPRRLRRLRPSGGVSRLNVDYDVLLWSERSCLFGVSLNSAIFSWSLQRERRSRMFVMYTVLKLSIATKSRDFSKELNHSRLLMDAKGGLRDHAQLLSMSRAIGDATGDFQMYRCRYSPTSQHLSKLGKTIDEMARTRTSRFRAMTPAVPTRTGEIAGPFHPCTRRRRFRRAPRALG